MKHSLPALMLAAAVTSASAQELPFNIEENWVVKVTDADLNGAVIYNEMRTGTGVNGKVYFLDKANKRLMSIDADGAKVVRTLPTAIGTAITSDDAGNLLYSRAWAGVNSAVNLSIIPASDIENGEISNITASYPEGYTPSRNDNFGRLVGDMLSEKGAVGYLWMGNQTSIAPLHIAAGSPVADFASSTSTEIPATNNYYTAVAVPRFNSIDEQLSFSPIQDGFYIHNRSSAVIYYANDGKLVSTSCPNSSGNEGFDAFTLDGEQYFVTSYTDGTATNYGAGWVITDAKANIVWQTSFSSDFAPQKGTFNNGGGIVARKISDNKVEIYTYQSVKTYIIASMYTITLDGEEEPDPVDPVDPDPVDPIEPDPDPDHDDRRAAFAHRLFAEKNGHGYDITFHSSEAAESGQIVLTPIEGNLSRQAPLVFPIEDIQVGENTARIDPTQETLGIYNWAVQLNTHAISGQEPKVLYKEETSGLGRGGLVCITDHNYDSYGYTLVSISRGNGIDIYDPAGEFVTTAKPANLFPATISNSIPLRGDQRKGKAVFASWADGTTAGYYIVDPLDPDKNAQNMLVGEAASSGLHTYNGVETAGGSPCVAFMGEGEDTKMWIFEEDLYKNQLACYNIGESDEITMAASTNCTWSNGTLLNTWVCLEPTPYGFFAAQSRGNGMETGVSAFVFVSPSGDKLKNLPTLLAGSDYKLPSSNGAIAITKDLSTLAVGTYTGIEFFTVTWGTEDGLYQPVALEHLYGVTFSTSTNFGQAKFDAANNLHYTAVQNTSPYNGVKYAVVTLPGQNVASTPAVANSLIEFTTFSGVYDIEASESAAQPVWYNLQGIRVDADALTPGVYVKVTGQRSEKVRIR